ncbi:MAG TPA: PE family protein [Mycobacterium sp.]|nr:PE family protein [Mycobacterium sp.]
MVDLPPSTVLGPTRHSANSLTPTRHSRRSRPGRHRSNVLGAHPELDGWEVRMSLLIAAPEMVAAAATDLAAVGSTISAANAAAALPTTSIIAAGADEVSVILGALFGAHAEAYQALSAGRDVSQPICAATERGCGQLRRCRGGECVALADRSARRTQPDKRARPGAVGSSADR